MGGSRLIAHCSLHPLSGEAKPQPPKFLDVTLKFLDIIVAKREEKYKNIGSFTPKTSDLFMQKVKENKLLLSAKHEILLPISINTEIGSYFFLNKPPITNLYLIRR